MSQEKKLDKYISYLQNKQLNCQTLDNLRYVYAFSPFYFSHYSLQQGTQLFAF